MTEDYGPDFEKDIITIVDDDGTEFNLEYIDTMDYNGSTYHAYLPTDIEPEDPDYGFIILRSVMDGEDELLESIDDDDELTDVFNHFMVLLYDEDEEAEEEDEGK